MVNKVRRKDEPSRLLITTNSLKYNVAPLLSEAESRGIKKAVFVKQVLIKYAENYPDTKELIASLEKCQPKK